MKLNSRKQILLRKAARTRDKKRRIKNKKRKYMLYYLLVAIILISVSSILSLTVFFKVEYLNLKCNLKKNRTNQLLTQINVKIGDSLILVNSDKIIKNLMQMWNTLGDITIEKKFPNTLNINCVFNKLTFILETDQNQFFGVSKSGRLIKQFIKEPRYSNLLTIKLKTNNIYKLGNFINLNDKEIKLINQIIKEITLANLKNITKIEIETLNKIQITVDYRIKIKIDNLSTVNQLLQSSSEIINNYIGTFEHGTLYFSKNDKTIHFIPDLNYDQFDEDETDSNN